MHYLPTGEVGCDGAAHEHALGVGHYGIGRTHCEVDPGGGAVLEAAGGREEVGRADRAGEDQGGAGLPPGSTCRD